jgi:hypothetical protein
MNPGVVSLVCPQGATFQKTLTYKIGRNPVDITGWTARMQVRERYEAESVLLNITTENGGITLGGRAGTIDLYVSDEVTAGFIVGPHVYDLELINTTGEVTRLIEGKFSVTPEVTR